MGLQRGLPILAICRGSQALNVACGGTLHQHVPGHRQTETGDRADARGRDRRRARACTGSFAPARSPSTPSTTRRSTSSATACGSSRARQDGTIEAIEGDGFVVGVQWHAETLMAHMPLFEALVTAASRTELRAAA